jgi:mono/diheme cytochrome c family protein
VPLHGDRELFRFVRDGLRTMPAWGGRLADDEIWHVVNYMRTLTTVTDR